VHEKAPDARRMSIGVEPFIVFCCCHLIPTEEFCPFGPATAADDLAAY
jgi:hypothetical protein